MDKQILADRAVVGLPKLFGDMDFDSPVFTAKVKDFIVGTFMDGNMEQFKYEIKEFTGSDSDEAIFDAIQLHVDTCIAELKQLAIGYKLDLIIKRFK